MRENHHVTLAKKSQNYIIEILLPVGIYTEESSGSSSFFTLAAITRERKSYFSVGARIWVVCHH